jgi:hypothetical protein
MPNLFKARDKFLVYLPTPPGMGGYSVETIKIDIGCNMR